MRFPWNQYRELTATWAGNRNAKESGLPGWLLTGGNGGNLSGSQGLQRTHGRQAVDGVLDGSGRFALFRRTVATGAVLVIHSPGLCRRSGSRRRGRRNGRRGRRNRRRGRRNRRRLRRNRRRFRSRGYSVIVVFLLVRVLVRLFIFFRLAVREAGDGKSGRRHGDTDD